MIGLSIGIGLTRVIGQGGAANPIIVSPGSTNSPPAFHKAMWSAYRTAAGMPAVWNWS